jgi:hypothetical protein
MDHRTILISVDALRGDYFSAEYFPNSWPIFSKSFSVFSDTHSHGTATPIAFPGLITGTTQIGDGSLLEDIPTLAELHTGQCIARPNNPHLSPERGYDQGIDGFAGRNEKTIMSRLKSVAGKSDFLTTAYNHVQATLQDSTPSSPYTLAEQLSARVIEDLQSDPQFLWAHYMDPHTPHTQTTLPDQDLPKSNTYYQELSNKFFDFDVSNAETKVLRELYEKHIQYLDRHLESVLRELTAKEWWDNALIIFVADHGEAFDEEGQLAHPWDNDPIDVVTHVPLAVKFPNESTTSQFDHTVCHSDIYAEVAAYTHPDLDVYGKRLRNEEERIIISKSNSSIRGVSNTGRLTVRRDGSKAETGDVSDELRETVGSESFPEVALLSGEVVGIEQSKDVEERLEALGYK